MTLVFKRILGVLTLIKNYTDMVKIIFQTNIEKKRTFKFYKKGKFCVEFLAPQHISFSDGNFSYRHLRAKIKCEIEKTCCFYSNFMYFTYHICPEQLLKATDT